MLKMDGFKSYGCFSFVISKFGKLLSRSKHEKRDGNRSNKRIKIVEPKLPTSNTGKPKTLQSSKVTAPASRTRQENSRKVSTTSSRGTSPPPKNQRRKISSSYTRKLSDAIDLDDTSRGNRYIATTKASTTVDKTSKDSNVNRQRWKRGMDLINEKKHEIGTTK
uniref:Uncharacterized protein n=1 Tax=Clytia hemisphaerica TaxID=252671 RepID=A0A7M6DRY4_9CNID